MLGRRFTYLLLSGLDVSSVNAKDREHSVLANDPREKNNKKKKKQKRQNSVIANDL